MSERVISVRDLRQRACDLKELAADIRKDGAAGLREGHGRDPAFLEFMASQFEALANTAERGHISARQVMGNHIAWCDDADDER